MKKGDDGGEGKSQSRIDNYFSNRGSSHTQLRSSNDSGRHFESLGFERSRHAAENNSKRRQDDSSRATHDSNSSTERETKKARTETTVSPYFAKPPVARDESREFLELTSENRKLVEPDDEDTIWQTFSEIDEETLNMIDRKAAIFDIKPNFARPKIFSIADIIHPPMDIWDADHVKLPCSRKNCFKDDAGRLKLKWDLIKVAFLNKMSSAEDLQTAILVYNDFYAGQWRFSSLHQFFNGIASFEEACSFWNDLLPKMVDLCLKLPELITQPLPLLRSNESVSITLSQTQIACLMANAFFCTFPRRNSPKPDSEFYRYPSINFNQLFGGDCTQKIAAKYRCLFNYFRRVTSKDAPTGLVTFTRRVMTTQPSWPMCDLKLCGLKVKSSGTIEDDGGGMLQMDFANMRIGGGVFGRGAVQEEIRFLICPELIVSRLFCEDMAVNEAILIHGAERYSNYSGYADTFQWESNHIDQTPRDGFNRRQTEIVAVDALHFTDPSLQFKEAAIRRELNKAVAGFYTEEIRPSAVAGGMWGCGVFNGDPELKSLIQMMACTMSGRDFVFFSFGDELFQQHLESVHAHLIGNGVTVGALFDCLLDYCKNCASDKKYYNNVSVFEHLSNYFKLGLSFLPPLSPTQQQQDDLVVTSATSVVVDEEKVVETKATSSEDLKHQFFEGSGGFFL